MPDWSLNCQELSYEEESAWTIDIFMLYFCLLVISVLGQGNQFLCFKRERFYSLWEFTKIVEKMLIFIAVSASLKFKD